MGEISPLPQPARRTAAGHVWRSKAALEPGFNFVESGSNCLLFEHDPFGKPGSTFPDHILAGYHIGPKWPSACGIRLIFMQDMVGCQPFMSRARCSVQTLLRRTGTGSSWKRVDSGSCSASIRGACHRAALRADPLAHVASRPGHESHRFAFPRRERPGPGRNRCAEKTEGAGNAGCWPHPQPRVQSGGSTRVSSPQVQPRSPGIPHAMVLTGSFVISPAIGLSCHRRKRHAQALSPT
jgi:hypothetical protein